MRGLNEAVADQLSQHLGQIRSQGLRAVAPGHRASVKVERLASGSLLIALPLAAHRPATAATVAAPTRRPMVDCVAIWRRCCSDTRAARKPPPGAAATCSVIVDRGLVLGEDRTAPADLHLVAHLQRLQLDPVLADQHLVVGAAVQLVAMAGAQRAPACDGMGEPVDDPVAVLHGSRRTAWSTSSWARHQALVGDDQRVCR